MGGHHHLVGGAIGRVPPSRNSTCYGGCVLTPGWPRVEVDEPRVPPRPNAIAGSKGASRVGIDQTLASISTPDQVEDPPGHPGVHRWSAHRDAQSLFLTTNADTIYSWTVVDLTSGPMVVCSTW